VEVVAGDTSCWVSSWNGVGQLLWRQVTRDSGTAVDNSTLALGQMKTTSDPNRPPEAVVGAMATPGLWGYEGDEWHDYGFSYNYTDRFPIPTNCTPVYSSPAIGPIDDDGINDVAAGDQSGVLWVWLSTDSAWHTYGTEWGLESSPVIVEIDSQRMVIFGHDNGRVYNLRWNETTESLEDSPGWSGGVLLPNASPIKASPIVGDVTNADSGKPQIVVAAHDGKVYALWADGTNHTGGAIAHVWTCVQCPGRYKFIHASPTVCSLDGANLSMIVGASDGIYKIDLYPTTEFEPNTPRWPWPTFHRDNARTGCATSPSSTKTCASIIGRVTQNGVHVQGASVQVECLNGGTPQVYGRPTEERDNPVYTVGTGDTGDEINEGGYMISQLAPNTTYHLIVNGGQPVSVSVTTGATIQDIAL